MAMFFMFWTCLCIFSVSAELQLLEQPIKSDGSLSFLVVGDWGRKGDYNQSQVAQQMGKIGDELNIDFIVSTGDNFYEDGLRSINDNAFDKSFTQIYTAESLQKQWYSVLGNHDYRGNVEAQLNPILGKLDSRWFCQRSFVLNAEVAEFFFVDTTPFVDKYFLRPKHHHYDWRGVLPRKEYLSNLLKDLDSALRNSAANWKIVIGHHTIKSVGHHGHTKELVKQVLPILEANNVDLYINAHDHCLEHMSSTTSPIQFLTSGGGSKAWKGDFDRMDHEGLIFYHDGQGFMSVQLTRANAKIVFYDVLGRVLHDLNLSKGLNYAMNMPRRRMVLIKAKEAKLQLMARCVRLRNRGVCWSGMILDGVSLLSQRLQILSSQTSSSSHPESHYPSSYPQIQFQSQLPHKESFS